MNFWQRGRLRIAKFLGLDLLNAHKRYGRDLDSLVSPGIRWLDIGCGKQVVPSWVMDLDGQRRMVAKASLLVGMDVDPSIREHPLLKARVMAVGEYIPFGAETFDLLSANAVVEHVADPRRFLLEACRVLKSGGRFLFHTPNYHHYLVMLASVTPDSIKRWVIWRLEGRQENDVFPTWYRLNTTSAIRKAAEECGLEVEVLSVVGSSGAFGRLGPVGWVECLLLKLLSSVGEGRFNSNLIVVLRRPPASKQVAISTPERASAAIAGTGGSRDQSQAI